MDIWDICKREPTVDSKTADQLQAWFFMSLISSELPDSLAETAKTLGVPVNFRVWSDVTNPGGHAFVIELIKKFRSNHAYQEPSGYDKLYTSEPMGVYNLKRSGEDMFSVGAFWTNGCYFFATKEDEDSIVNIFLAVDEKTCDLFGYPDSDTNISSPKPP